MCGERGRVDEAKISRCERLPRRPSRCRRLAADRERGLVALGLELDFDVVGCYWVVVERPERHHMGHRALLPRNVVRVVEVAGEHDAATNADRHKGGLDACALALREEHVVDRSKLDALFLSGPNQMVDVRKGRGDATSLSNGPDDVFVTGAVCSGHNDGVVGDFLRKDAMVPHVQHRALSNQTV